MTLNDWTAHIEEVREEISKAADDRGAILIAFTELAKLLLEIRFPEKEIG